MSWKSPWTNKKVLPQPGGEMTPFIFRGRLYRVENVMNHSLHPGKPVQYRFHEDFFRIRDVAEDRIVSVPLMNHYFASAFVYKDEVFIYAADYELDRPWWHCRRINVIKSKDLISWTPPTAAVEAIETESLFNNSVIWDGKRFVMLYETDDPVYTPKFTFKFAESDDLLHWRKIDGAIYGRDKYVGGPTLFFENGYYYTTYVNSLGDGCYDTRIARSKDLFTWEDAPADRPFLSPDYTRHTDPVNHPDVLEKNASDAELIEADGKVTVFWNGGNQMGVADSQEAEFTGTKRELFELFFAK